MGLITKPCILCLYSVYISDTQGALGRRSTDQEMRRRRALVVLPDAVISIQHHKRILFHSHAANAPVFLLTHVNLFIYLNQITNKSKIKTGM